MIIAAQPDTRTPEERRASIDAAYAARERVFRVELEKRSLNRQAKNNANDKAKPMPEEPLKEPQRPTIDIESRLGVIADTCIGVLSDLPIYQRSKQLVDVIRDGKSNDGVIRPEGSPQIRTVPPAKLKEVLENAANFVKTIGKGTKAMQKSVRPPHDVIETVIARGEWHHIRLLRGIVNWPVFRPNGTILSQPGYDPDLSLIYEPDIHVDVPENPTREDALAAVDRFRDLMSEFPFAGPAHFSAWLAMLLTVFMQYAIQGSIPFGVIEAPQKRTGKTFAAHLIGYIASGRKLPCRATPDNPEEWRKAMLGIAIAADYAVFFDNVVGTLRSPVLDMVITSGVFKDRILGKNEDLALEILTFFLMTSNNATLSSDLIARSLLCRLEARCERPEERTFKHPDLDLYCRNHRAELIAAALSIPRAYAVAGRPDVILHPMAGFERWSTAIRAPLVWLGLEDPALTQESLRQHASCENDSGADLFRAWHDALGERWFYGKEIIDRLQDSDRLSTTERSLKDAVRAHCETRDGKLPTSLSFGKHLNQVRGQVFDGLILESKDRTEHGTPWRVRRLNADGSQVNPDDTDVADVESRHPMRETPSKIEAERLELSSASSASSGADFCDLCGRSFVDCTCEVTP